MKRPLYSVLITITACSLTMAEDWPHFRGPLGTSTATDKLEIDWTRPNIVTWRLSLPGRGPSSPMVVSGHVLITASSGVNQDRLHVLCFDAKDGKKLWERQFWATGRTITHPTSANAAPTPATDGKRVFAFYSSNDLVALDLDGNLLWYRGLAFDYPSASNDLGMSSSPLVVGDTVVVQVENQGDSFAAGLDTATGNTKWRLDRAPDAAWCSPIALRSTTHAREVVLLQSLNRLTAHDPETGRELWNHKATCDVIPTTATEGGILFVPSEGMTALDAGGNTSTPPAVIWKASTLNPGAASPVVAGGRLFIINRGGVLNCADATNGKVLWRLRLEGSFWSTPALVGDELICCADSGLVQIVSLTKDGTAGVVAGKVDLGEKIQSSPAVADGAVFVRSDRHLIKLK
jgi:outer membrane protein assembly factor BamB